jgi:phage/plasmid-associated DNA primase
MEPIYELCLLPHYRVNYENSKKCNQPIHKLAKVLQSDLQLHERLHKTDILKLAGDIDKFKKHNPSLTLEKLFNDISEFLNIDVNEICFTTNFSVETGSHHFVIPKYYLVSSKQKKLWKSFKEKYHYGDEIDADIFDKEGWFRLPNQTKEGVRGTEHIIQRGTIEDFVLKNVASSCIEYPFEITGVDPIQKNKKTSNTKGNDLKEDLHIAVKRKLDDDYLDLLFNVIKNEKDKKGNKIISWNNWFKIAGALKHNDYHLNDFISYSKTLSSKQDCENLWNSIKNEKTMSIFVLENIAKEINYEKYKEWKFNKNVPMFNELIKQPADENFAKLFYEYHGDDFLYNNEVVYYFNGLYWTETKTDLRRTYTAKFIKVLDELLLFETKKFAKIEPSSDEHESQRKKLIVINDIIFRMKSNSNIKAVCKDAILPYIENNNVNFEHNPYIICFNNVVFDLKTCDFVEPNKYDFMNLSTKYEWKEPTEEEVKELETIIEKILPDENIRTAYMTLLTTGLCGETLERFILANGSGGNGKGLLSELFEYTMGDYVYTCNSVLLQERQKAGANQEIANMNNKRAVFYREPSDSLPLNSSIIKEITGGNSINARALYSKNTTTHLKATNFLECNSRPTISGDTDDALLRRIIDVEFKSIFTEDEKRVDEKNSVFKGNKFYKSTEFKEKYKYAFFRILIKYWKAYMIQDMNIDKFLCKEIKDRTEAYLQNSNYIFAWFKEKYVVCEDDTEVVKIADIFEEFKFTEYYVNLPKKEKRELNKDKFIEKISRNVYLKRYYREDERRKVVKEKYDCERIRNVLVGFKKLEENED